MSLFSLRPFLLSAVFLSAFFPSLCPSVSAGEILWATVQHGRGDATYSLLHKLGGPSLVTHYLDTAPQQFKVMYNEDGAAGIVDDTIHFSYAHSVVGHDQNGVIKFQGRIRIQEAHDFDLGSVPSPLEEPTHLIRGYLRYELWEDGQLEDQGTFRIRENQYGNSFFNGVEYDGETGSLYIWAGERYDIDDETGYKRGIDLVVSLEKHSVPEPTSMAISALGLGGIAAARSLRRRRARSKR